LTTIKDKEKHEFTKIGNVFIDEKVVIDKTSTIGPNVSIGKGVKIGKGVRISNSIILDGTIIHDFAFCSYSIIGWNSIIGKWSRIQGSPNFNDEIEAVNKIFKKKGK
jgi:mannose-1-phosphate guanylyltransferase